MKKYSVNCVDVTRYDSWSVYLFKVYHHFWIFKIPVFSYEGYTVAECEKACNRYIEKNK